MHKVFLSGLAFLASMLPVHASETAEDLVNDKHNVQMTKFLCKNRETVFDILQKLNTPEYSKLVHLNFSSARCGSDYKEVLKEVSHLHEGRAVECRDLFVRNGDITMQWMIVSEDFEEDPYVHNFSIRLKKPDDATSEQKATKEKAAAKRKRESTPSALFFGLLVDNLQKKAKK